MFEGVRHERSHFLLLSLTNLHTLKESKFTDDEIYNIKSLALEKLDSQNWLKDYFALQLLE